MSVDHATNVPAGGNTVQWGMGRGLLCL